MKRLLVIAVTVCAASLCATSLGNAATAAELSSRLEQTALNGKAEATGDCALAKDPLRCEAQQKARDTCKGKRSGERRRCLAEQPAPVDCRRADNPRHCETLQAAREACRNKSGAQHRQCMRELTTQ